MKNGNGVAASIRQSFVVVGAALVITTVIMIAGFGTVNAAEFGETDLIRQVKRLGPDVVPAAPPDPVQAGFLGPAWRSADRGYRA